MTDNQDVKEDRLSKYIFDCAKSCGLNVDNVMAYNLSRFLLLLTKWNKVYNLTNITQEDEMVYKHILDSLTLVSPIREMLALKNNEENVVGSLNKKFRILDVGTGAGFPGIPLAIVFNEVYFTLLDSKRKKIDFLEYVSNVLKLTNVDQQWTRIQEFNPEEGFDLIVCRAFSSMLDFAQSCCHLLNNGGQMVAMKADFKDDEILELEGKFKVVRVTPVRVGDADFKRSLVFIENLN